MRSFKATAIAALTLVSLALVPLSASATPSWSTVVDLSDPTGIAGGAQLAVDSSGAPVSVYAASDANTGMTQVMFTRNANGWSTPVGIGTPSLSTWNPRIAAGPIGDLTILWSEEDQNGDPRFFFVRSTDLGATWSSPSAAFGPTGITDLIDVQLLVSPITGALTVIYLYEDNGTQYDISAVTSSNYGASWSTQQTIGTDVYDDKFATAISSTGVVAAAWSESDGSHDRITTATQASPGATWSSPTLLSTSGVHGVDPSLALGPNGSFLAAWAEGSPYVVKVAHTTSSLSTWSSSTSLSNSSAPARYPSLATTPSGEVFATWDWVYNQNGDTEQWIAQSSDSGATWTNQSVISVPNASSARKGKLVSDSQGIVTIAYLQMSTASSSTVDTISTRTTSDNGGTWTPVSSLTPLSGSGSDIRMAVTPNDDVELIWRFNIQSPYSDTIQGSSLPGTSSPSGSSTLTLAPGFGVGDLLPGAPVTLSGTGLQPNSPWESILRSTPITFASGTTDGSGNFSLNANLPLNIEPGQHSITLYGTTPSGAQWTRVLYVTVGANLRVLYMSTTGPQSSLAATGANVAPIGIAAGLLGLGGLLVVGTLVARKRRTS